jgi:hypothetical protein
MRQSYELRGKKAYYAYQTFSGLEITQRLRRRQFDQRRHCQPGFLGVYGRKTMQPVRL